MAPNRHPDLRATEVSGPRKWRSRSANGDDVFHGLQMGAMILTVPIWRRCHHELQMETVVSSSPNGADSGFRQPAARVCDDCVVQKASHVLQRPSKAFRTRVHALRRAGRGNQRHRRRMRQSRASALGHGRRRRASASSLTEDECVRAANWQQNGNLRNVNSFYGWP